MPFYGDNFMGGQCRVDDWECADLPERVREI